jgi:hypothetical protein
MPLRRTFLALTAPLALLLVGGCTEPFRADVTRFQRLPAPQDQSFFVVAADPNDVGGIEFSQYAALVAGRLTAQGYRPAASSSAATLLVSLGYGVDFGHEKVVTDFGFGYGPGFGLGTGFGGGFRRGWYGGWGDPFWSQPGGEPDIHSYTYYISHLTMKIRNRDGAVLFEGRARARSLDDHLQALVPNLIDAMFTGFPGHSGEDIRITIPPPPKTVPARGI